MANRASFYSRNMTAGNMTKEHRKQRDAAITERLRSGAPKSAVAAEFGLSRERVLQIAIRVGLHSPRPADASWPADRIAKLRIGWRRGLSTAAIGRRLGVSKGSVLGKARRLGLPPRPSPIARLA